MPGHLMVLDLPSLWYRAFHGVPDSVVSPRGEPVNLVRGTLDTVSRLLADERPARLVGCVDLDWRPAFRVAAVPSYKAHRVAVDGPAGAEAEPDGLAEQVALLREVLDAVGLAVVGVPGFEADDVLATLATSDGGPVDVVTGDRDLFQLVDDRRPVRVLYAVEKMRPYGEAEVAERFGIPGRAYADFAVLRGDPSDGLPGVKGIGDKTAAALLTSFGSLEGLRAAVAAGGDEGFPAGARRKLEAALDYLAVAPVVTGTVRDLPLPPHDSAVPPLPRDPDRLAALAQRWGLEGAAERLTTALAAAAG